ncbi:MAG: type I restriction-modification enzyme R subunit C-terminal domain-containing protein, partial [Chloroflexota bacterium]
RNIRNIVLMRPVKSMIEFKQIIGRGTRLFDGKDYFTIYDFVKAHEHFNDPDWDGEPESPDPPKDGGKRVIREDPPPRPDKIMIRLADGKERTIQSMVSTSFWSPDGKPLSSAQFLENLFGALPALVRDVDELRRIWSDPQTRTALLNQLAEQGFSGDQMEELQRIISAENSDIYDVLAFVAIASPPLTRQSRADQAQLAVRDRVDGQQRAFIEFVLGQYVAQGVGELDLEKLPALIKLRYGAVDDAKATLGSPEDIRTLFAGFQRFLYAGGGWAAR